MLKRKRLPWPSRKKGWGTQCTDEEAQPVKLQNHETLADVLHSCYLRMKRHNDHVALREQFNNPAEVYKS